jgi:catechol 2,3-dioxygenase-like lactoylglutathione lyase family enzyme
MFRVDHLAFPSFDAGETHRFYTEVLGFRLKFAVDGVSAAWGQRAYLISAYASGTTEVHFFAVEGIARPPDDGLPKDIRHIALAVGSRRAVTAWKRRLAACGVSHWEEDHDGAPSIYFSDPNGVMLEINCHRPEPMRRGAATAGLAVVRQWIARRGQRTVSRRAPVARRRR